MLGGPLRLEGDLLPIEVLNLSVFFKIFFVKHEDGADDSRIILETDLGYKIGDKIKKPVGVNNGKGGGGGGGVGQILVDALSKIFDHIRQKFELIDEVGKFRRVDLSEFRFE